MWLYLCLYVTPTMASKYIRSLNDKSEHDTLSEFTENCPYVETCDVKKINSDNTLNVIHLNCRSFHKMLH